MIQQIAALRCPTCKAGVRSESRSNKHTNGYWNEDRIFTCGLHLHFSPNFMRVELGDPYGMQPVEALRFDSMCAKDPRRLANEKDQKGALAALDEWLKEHSYLPESTKDKLRRVLA